MIRLARECDLDSILEIYQKARDYMEATGNPSQWGKNHPPRELLEDDIKKEQLYVFTENGITHGVFAFIIGPDPTYSYIEDGEWMNEEEYGTIHRIAGDGAAKGVFGNCLDYCRSRISNLRIDTHQDNHTMQHLIEKNGFKRCGIVYMEDGSPRIAYQYCT